MQKGILLGVGVLVLVLVGGVFLRDTTEVKTADQMNEKGDTMMQEKMEKMDDMSASDTMNDGETLSEHMDDTMDKNDAENMMKKEKMMTTAGTYEAYAPEKLALAEDGTVILFFHASWCPPCKKTDAALNASRDDIPNGVHILKLDYDTETALKQQYGVTYQHTFVQVDARGTLLTKWSGTTDLDAILAKIVR